MATYDYIIAGGGNAGCVIASRLSKELPHSSIALVEAGPDAHDNPTVQSPLGGPMLHGTDLEWNAMSMPQKGLDERQIYQTGGKLLSGSSAVNYGMWTRGPANDFNRWSETVGAGKWSYEDLLPYFKRSETWYGTDKYSDQHGFTGPIHSVEPEVHPLRETLRESFEQAGVPYVPDANTGHPLGFSLFSSNWHNYARQPAGMAYDLSNVTVLTDTSINRIVLDESGSTPFAKGIELKTGEVLKARKEVIVSCGSFGTPKLLMLSGLGDAPSLKSHGIKPVLNIPSIGQNLHDHPLTLIMWSLRHPEKGLAIGSSKFPESRYGPNEWVYTGLVKDKTRLATALLQDNPTSDPAQHPSIVQPGAHFEMTVSYVAVGAELMGGHQPPEDGSIVTTACGVVAPTSRGAVTLTSSDPDAPLAINPNYLTTEHDRCIFRDAVRQTIAIMDTPAARREVQGLYSHPEMPAVLAPDSTDDEIDAYLRKTAISWFHPAGTAAMGDVVDSECRVNGVDKLRVVDASIFPFPLAAHYQSPIYAIAERAVDIIVGSDAA